ncbi:hypothetical protein CKO31_02845 [Thiohalocapsa halophila]|uniref:Uncharacterized protein n=1 Tax=Thiohalocapsa halophila TaxID=69359 RepID=A0ABS1CCQ8_9GAMM|nr:hypothetical protein [Thiohalocapsa halophila]MBK1629692.1 hypothetical protein [Thiohalocapsa halophila]
MTQQGFAREVWVPAPVAAQIHRRGPQDITSRVLRTTGRLRVYPEPSIPEPIARRRLGAGESATLAIAAGCSARRADNCVCAA